MRKVINLSKMKMKIFFNISLATIILSGCASSVFINEKTEEKLTNKEIMVLAYPFKNHTGDVIAQNKSLTTHIGNINNFEDYLRSSMSYSNAKTLNQFIGKAQIIKISDNAYNRFKK